MQRFKYIGLLAFIMLILASMEIYAQPRGGGGSGGRGGRGAGQVARFLPIEQILSYFAFNENVALSDEQFVKVRGVLKDTYAMRQELVRSMRGNNDQQAAMQKVRKLRGEMTQGLSDVLNAHQTKSLREYMQRQGQRGRDGRGGPGGRGSGRRGGGGGGRGGGGDGA